MYIDSRSWHARVYRWWKVMKYGENQWRAPSTVNLCPYCRAVLFWSWSRYLMLSGRVKLGKYRVSVPKLFWGAQPILALLAAHHYLSHKGFITLLQVLGFIVCVLSATSILALVAYGIYRFFTADPVVDAREAVMDGAASFTRVLVERTRGAHNRICPVLEFREPTE